MTDDERAALRDEIEGLTIKQAKARGESATETLNILRELGLVGPVAPMLPTQMTMRHPAGGVVQIAPVPGDPFPCPVCGRTATERPGEATQPVECLQCGNHLPLPAGAQGPRVSNKGPLVMDPEMLARRQALIAAPAFDENGEPT